MESEEYCVGVVYAEHGRVSDIAQHSQLVEEGSMRLDGLYGQLKDMMSSDGPDG